MLTDYLREGCRIKIYGKASYYWYPYIKHDNDYIWFTSKKDIDWKLAALGIPRDIKKHKFQINKLYAVSYPVPDGEVVVTDTHLCYLNANEQYHRIDGPAIEYLENFRGLFGYQAYYINGQELTEVEFNFWRKVNATSI